MIPWLGVESKRYDSNMVIRTVNVGVEPDCYNGILNILLEYCILLVSNSKQPVHARNT